MKVPLAVRVLPGATWKAWLTPPPLGTRTRLRDDATTRPHRRIQVADFEALEIGDGPVVVAVHGWGGRPAQMVPLAARLAAAGFRVVIPTLPGHAGGQSTDVKQAALAIRAVVGELDPPAAVVGHSFAGITLRLAFLESAPPLVVLLAPLVHVRDAVSVFATRLRVMPWARRGLLRRLVRWDRSLWPIVDGPGTDQYPGAELLVLHDPDDPETPFAASAAMAIRRPRTEIAPISGVGHAGILSEDSVVEAVAAFVNARARPDTSLDS
jgi:hypothetical protein